MSASAQSGEGQKCRGCGGPCHDCSVLVAEVGWMHMSCEIKRLNGYIDDLKAYEAYQDGLMDEIAEFSGLDSGELKAALEKVRNEQHRGRVMMPERSKELMWLAKSMGLNVERYEDDGKLAGAISATVIAARPPNREREMLVYRSSVLSLRWLNRACRWILKFCSQRLRGLRIRYGSS